MSRTTRTKTTHWLRRPKTLNEKRQATTSLEQGVPSRPARKANYLPDTYDDIRIAAGKEFHQSIKSPNIPHGHF